MQELSDPEPLRVYGSEVSYFTGKLEAYLRYKGIAYERTPLPPDRIAKTAPDAKGAAQMPAVALPDGRWMTDTTPIIASMEASHPEPAVIPANPVQALASRLLEDYADEWLWRPAMHYRWSHRRDRRLLSDFLVEELTGHLPIPAFVKRRLVTLRQYSRFVRGDGVDGRTRGHVEATYTRTLAQLQAVFASRPFLLGESPTLADFGFMASMFRHFGMDPTPAAIMRDRAPAVYEWVARLWNARPRTAGLGLVEGIPADWSPILEEIGSAYLPYLAANAKSWNRGQRRFDVEVQGVVYRNLPTSRYRVWCLEQLRAHCDALPDGARPDARRLLEAHGCWEPMWSVETRSGYDEQGSAPFNAGLVIYE